MSPMDPEQLDASDMPAMFGRYTLLAVLGEGGMGRVFRASRRGAGTFEKVVALKVLRRSVVGQYPSLIDAFREEARIGALLNHPQVVATNDFELIDGHPTIAMEYLRGLTLQALLQADGQFDEADIVEIALQSARGLAAAHSFEDGAHDTQLVHRDIKPANLFVTRDGIVKLLDLGITQSRRIDVPETDVGLAQGTLGYMSPEQLSGRPLDGRTDIFSLGVVLYELATGERLFGDFDAATDVGQFGDRLCPSILCSV